MNVQNINLQTPLHLAVERQHTQIVRYDNLLSESARLSEPSSRYHLAYLVFQLGKFVPKYFTQEGY